MTDPRYSFLPQIPEIDNTLELVQMLKQKR